MSPLSPSLPSPLPLTKEELCKGMETALTQQKVEETDKTRRDKTRQDKARQDKTRQDKIVFSCFAFKTRPVAANVMLFCHDRVHDDVTIVFTMMS